MTVTIEDTFLENTLQHVIRVRRDGWMIACFHYRATRYEWSRLSKAKDGSPIGSSRPISEAHTQSDADGARRSRLNVADWEDLMRIHLSGPSPDRAEVRATLTAALRRF